MGRLQCSRTHLQLCAAPIKKDKKIDVMESQVLDPAAYDNPEFEVVTAWRPDRLKRLTYTQLWFLIREHKIAQVANSPKEALC